MTWLIRNWHLKLGAVALALVLYTGFVYSGSFTEQTFQGVAVQGINQPNASYPLTQNMGAVDIRYRLAADATSRVTPDSFSVTVDLSSYNMDLAPAAQALSISVRPLAEGLTILNYSPATVAVEIDRIGTKEVPVVVDRGEVPEGLAIGTPQVSERTVTATGPESRLGRVERAVARVQIFDSGIDVSLPQVDLLPVDVDGAVVDLVELSPRAVSVRIDVRTVETSKTVPIRPILSGSVADGFELARLTVQPAVVTLFGLPEVLSPIEEVATSTLSVSGLSETTTLEGELVLPSGTRLAVDSSTIAVIVEVQPAVATRTFIVGIECANIPAGFACLPAQGQLALTVSGTATALGALNPADLVVTVDVDGLPAGDHNLTPTVTLPSGVELVSISPGTVTVTLAAPATPAPTSPPG